MILLIPTKYLMPVVAMVSFVGIYGISGSSFDLMVMVLFGLLGWLLRKLSIPLVPVIMGVILGEPMESNLRRAMTIYDGDWSKLLSSNVSLAIWSITIIGFVLPFFFRKKIKSTMSQLKD
jgi:putative tricarboxylic transport membrane protein